MLPLFSSASPSGPPPRALFALMLAYPLLTHLAVYLRSLALTAAAAMVLLLLVLGRPLRAGRWWAWLGALGGAGMLLWFTLSGARFDALFALYAAPVLIYLFLAWLFGSTLRPGQVPLVSRLAAHLHGQERLTEPDIIRYTRRLTLAWTALFLLLATVNALLALLASPDGVLELLGLASPWPLPPTWWSLFANVLSFGLVAMLFVIEFGYRRRRFPEQHARYRGLLDFLNHMREEMPALLGAQAAPTTEAAATDAPRMLREPSRRALLLWSVLLAHLLGLAAVSLGYWPLALALIVPSHLLLVWASLVPDSTLFGPLIRGFDTPRREVWLSIDDGPSRDTPALLDLLDAHGAKASFFLVGERAVQHPEQVNDILRRGHQIGNHSASHPSAWFWALPPGAMRRQIETAQQQLLAVGGRAPQLFRAVVGMSNPFVEPVLRQLGLQRVGWSARGFDSVVADPEAVWQRLQKGLCPGAVLLLHEGAAHGQSVAILARVLQQLDAQGYRCVLPALPEAGRSATTSQLLNGVAPHSGEKCALSPASPSKASSAPRSG